MGRTFELLVTIVLIITLNSVQAGERTSLNSSLNSEQVPISETLELLDELYQTRGERPLLIFVHGRGQHPL